MTEVQFNVIELLQASAGMTTTDTLEKIQAEFVRLYQIERMVNCILDEVGKYTIPSVAWLDDLATVCDRHDIPESFYTALSNELIAKESEEIQAIYEEIE